MNLSFFTITDAVAAKFDGGLDFILDIAEDRFDITVLSTQPVEGGTEVRLNGGFNDNVPAFIDYLRKQPAR
jgi:hypothetical protein